MIISKDPFSYQAAAPSAVTIGKFDGIHRGHQVLIRDTVSWAEAQRAAGRPAQSVVFAFDMAPSMLLTKRERRTMLEKMGVDLLIECSFGPKMITMPADAFMKDMLAGRLHAAHVTVGEDFRFGCGRTGSGRLLEEAGPALGFDTRIVPEVTDGGEPVSSTRIRAELTAGHMETVGRLLGYPYFITGKVIHGRQIGRTIGVPTANQIPGKSKLLPPNGVYFTESDFGGRTYRGITNVGMKPTVDGHYLDAETYFFDCDQDIYDRRLTVRLLHFSRPEKKFSSLEALKERIGLDAEEGHRFFAGLDEAAHEA
ncbi:MAG: riboflavin biosynthesis protein RibF [Clostridiales bacterium]|nr:riboflavin biosynthesis protein RibF [Clostridiales bacterium]